jgi:hypothetical protein
MDGEDAITLMARAERLRKIAESVTDRQARDALRNEAERLSAKAQEMIESADPKRRR